MSKYTTPNFFCGECSKWQMYGEPGTTREDNRQILRYCQNECTAWRTQAGASLYTLNGVYQCWNCINHMPKYDEVIKDADSIWVCYPYCGQCQEVIHKLDINITNNGKCLDWGASK